MAHINITEIMQSHYKTLSTEEQLKELYRQYDWGMNLLRSYMPEEIWQ